MSQCAGRYWRGVPQNESLRRGAARLTLAFKPELVGDLRLVDVEDDEITEITMSAPLLKRYKANLAAYCDQLRDFCLRRDMSLLTVRSDTPIETLVLDYLRKRGVVK